MSKLALFATLTLRLVLIPIRRLAAFLFPPGDFDGVASAVVADQASRAFIKLLGETYGTVSSTNTPNGSGFIGLFETLGYSAILSQISAATQTYNNVTIDNSSGSLEDYESDFPPPPPLLLIYLHSPLHAQASHFLASSLLHPETLELLQTYSRDGLLKCWGASIHTADGDSVRTSLGASSFPFLAIVRVKAPSTSSRASSATRVSLEIHLRLQGFDLRSTSSQSSSSAATTPPSYKLLQKTIQRYQMQLDQTQSQRVARLEDQRLQQEQDLEYHRALEEDQRRDAQRKAEESRQAEALRKIREEQEQLAREKRQKVDEARRVLDQAEQDNANHSSTSDANTASSPRTTRVRFVLPSGQRIEQTFRTSDTIHVLKAFLIVYFHEKKRDDGSMKIDKEISNFDLILNYPKRKLSDIMEEQEGATLQDVEGLCPQAVIMIQDLDA